MDATRPPVTLPAHIVEALLQVALRTDVGAALVAGFRAGHADLVDQPGSVEVRVQAATVTVRVVAPSG